MQRLEMRQTRQALFEDVINNARSHGTIHSGGRILRHDGRRVEDERNEFDVGRGGLGEQ